MQAAVMYKAKAASANPAIFWHAPLKDDMVCNNNLLWYATICFDDDDVDDDKPMCFLKPMCF